MDSEMMFKKKVKKQTFQFDKEEAKSIRLDIKVFQ